MSELLARIDAKLSELRYTKQMGAQMWGERVNICDDDIRLFEDIRRELAKQELSDHGYGHGV